MYWIKNRSNILYRYKHWYPVILVSVGLISALLCSAIFIPTISYKDGEIFEIKKGQSFADTTRLLLDKGIIRRPYAFVLYSLLSGEYHFKAGYYKIPDITSISGLVNLFYSGLSNDVRITIFEGGNVNDLEKWFVRAGLAKEGDFVKFGAYNYEGYLFPDTYRFSAGTPIGVMLTSMHAQYNQEIMDNLPNTVLNRETIIIASMLEKEVRKPDMALVAGIIYRRLKLGMKLQLDATVAYGVCRVRFLNGENCETSKIPVGRYLDFPSAYNTYYSKGLPPGPISNPGIVAIKAALNPVASDYLYYLTAPDGRTIFSRTGAEHEAARIRYLSHK